MKILWVFAHPEQRSLNASLMADGLRDLAELGHEARVSDLYAMGWNPLLAAQDVRPEPDPGARLSVGDEQERAYAAGELSEDILVEQRKIAWADVLVLHFPFWWFGPPAILKGWFDRVFVQGFAFGVRDERGRTRRYGDGGLAGRRALVVTSVGARESGFGPRGIHGQVDEVLFPVLHGTFWYTGMAALPPFVVYGADRMTTDGYAYWSAALRERLRTLPTAEPVPYRSESGDDYDVDLVLKPGVAPGSSGVGAQVRRAGAGRVPAGGVRRPLLRAVTKPVHPAAGMTRAGPCAFLLSRTGTPSVCASAASTHSPPVPLLLLCQAAELGSMLLIIAIGPCDGTRFRLSA